MDNIMIFHCPAEKLLEEYVEFNNNLIGQLIYYCGIPSIILEFSKPYIIHSRKDFYQNVKILNNKKVIFISWGVSTMYDNISTGFYQIIK